MRRRAWLICGLLVSLVASGASATAAAPDVGRLSPTSGAVTWKGTFTTSNPVGCGRRGGDEVGCERRRLVVDAPAGSWITITIDPDTSAIDVATDDGTEVAQNGQRILSLDGSGTTRHGGVTFQQVRSGAVGYVVGVSSAAAVPSSAVTEPEPFTVRAVLAGKAFDRTQNCVQAPPERTPAVPADTSRRLPLRVRLVTSVADLPFMKKESAYLVEVYRRIGVDVRVSLDTMAVPDSKDQFVLIDAVRARYGGMRPRGTDVVFLGTDNFAGGGFALCVGGVAFPEQAFAVGGLHYKANGSVSVPYVRAGLIAAHEIGHLLGGQHHYATCGLGADTSAPGTAGPCTVMFPAAAGASGGFSPLETAYLRDYAGRFGAR